MGPGKSIPKKGDHVTSKNLPARRLAEAIEELAALLMLANTYDACEGLRLLFKTIEKSPPPTIEKALGFEEDNPRARELLADYYWDRFLDAETEGDREGLAFFRARVATYHDGISWSP